MARLHRLAGLGFVLLFVATGLWLRFRGQAVIEQDDAIRFSLRANHVYILFSGLVNIAVGMNPPDPAVAWRRRVQLVGSALLLTAPLLLLAAFIVEGPQARAFRPITEAGVILMFLAVMCQVPARARHVS